MNAHAKWISRLAAGLSLAALVAAPSWAQDPNYNTTRSSAPLPPTVTFSTVPVWERVPGTQVSVIRQDQRPTFDMFSFGNEYFLYSNEFWYRASAINGPFVALEGTAVPPELHSVPRANWLKYPADWDKPATVGGTAVVTAPAPTVKSDWVPTVSFTTVPHWTMIPGTRIYQVRAKERPAHDLFRFGANYYVYQNANWYRGTTVQGPYSAIAIEEVPPQFRKVRERYWVSYPSGWTYTGKSVRKRR